MQRHPSAGYTALHQSTAWIDLSGRGRLRITGEDRVRLVNAMTTNQVQNLQPGKGCYLFFLNAQGRIQGDANLFVFEDHLLLDTEPETRQKIYEHLDRYIIADDVTLADVTETTVAFALEGPQAPTALSHLAPGLQLPVEPYSWAAWGARTLARVNSTGSAGFCVFASAVEKAALLTEFASAGIPEATSEDSRIVRIEQGHPRYGEEITERYLVQETGQLQAVSFSKGCYLGQEIVERVRSRAQIHRLLQRIEIDTADVPPVGTKLTSGAARGAAPESASGASIGEAEAAEIVSAAYSPELGKVAAMAYVKIQFAKPGTELAYGNLSGRVLPAST